MIGKLFEIELTPKRIYVVFEGFVFITKIEVSTTFNGIQHKIK